MIASYRLIHIVLQIAVEIAHQFDYQFVLQTVYISPSHKKKERGKIHSSAKTVAMMSK